MGVAWPVAGRLARRGPPARSALCIPDSGLRSPSCSVGLGFSFCSHLVPQVCLWPRTATGCGGPRPAVGWPPTLPPPSSVSAVPPRAHPAGLAEPPLACWCRSHPAPESLHPSGACPPPAAAPGRGWSASTCHRAGRVTTSGGSLEVLRRLSRSHRRPGWALLVPSQQPLWTLLRPISPCPHSDWPSGWLLALAWGLGAQLCRGMV